jgi:hypothetical protein
LSRGETATAFPAAPVSSSLRMPPYSAARPWGTPMCRQSGHFTLSRGQLLVVAHVPMQ